MGRAKKDAAKGSKKANLKDTTGAKAAGKSLTNSDKLSKKSGFVNVSGRTNGLVNGRGLTNGRGITNGNGLVNGRGITNGNGLVNGRGITNGNGLVNGKGYVNGMGRMFFKESQDSKKTITILVTLCICVSAFGLVITNWAFPKFSANIAIDGSFEDWAILKKYPDIKGDHLQADCDITKFSVEKNGDMVYFYAAVQGKILTGASNGVDTVQILIDSDGNPSTGYEYSSLGADLRIDIAGWDGVIKSTTIYQYSNQTIRGAHDWNAWEAVGYAQACIKGKEMEIGISTKAFSISSNMRAMIFITGSGATDSTYAIGFDYGALVIEQSWTAPKAISSNGNNRVLGLDLQAYGSDVRLDSISLTYLGTLAAPNAFLQVSEGERVSGSIAGSKANFAFTNGIVVKKGKTMHIDAYLQITVSSSSIGNTTGLVLASSSDVRMHGQIGVSVMPAKVPADLADTSASVSMIGSSQGIVIDGSFLDWAGISKNAGPFASSVSNANIDLTDCRVANESSSLFFYAEVEGNLFVTGGVPHATVPRVRPTGPGGGEPVFMQQLFSDILLIYIDNGSAGGKNVALSDGRNITADHRIEVYGNDGRILMTSVSQWDGKAWVNRGTVDAAKDDKRIELGAALSSFVGLNISRASVAFFMMGWDREECKPSATIAFGSGSRSARSNGSRDYTTHEPIRINSDSDFTAANGVISGNGDSATPYRISGYDIDATNDGNAIFIAHTTKFFVIDNCYLHSASGNSGQYYWNSGLALYDVLNGKVENNTISSNTYGIYIDGSSADNVFCYNTIQDNSGYGAYVTGYSQNNKFYENKFTNNNGGSAQAYCDANGYHAPITVDGSGSDWLGQAPSAANSYTTSRGEWIWTDAEGDVRTDFSNPSREDILEFRTTTDGTFLYFLVKMKNIDLATGDGAPMVQIAIDKDMTDYSGESWFAANGDLQTSPSAQWEFLVMTQFGSASSAPRLYQVGSWTPISSGGAQEAISSTNSLIEIRVELATIGATLPSNLRFTVASFRANAGDDTWDINSVPDALDAITSMSGNTWNEVSDGKDDYYFDITFGRSPNLWNDLTKGNIWSDHLTPDDDHDGIVDTPYTIAGSAGDEDELPQAIPEFSDFAVPVGAVVLFAAIALRRKKWGEQ